MKTLDEMSDHAVAIRLAAMVVAMLAMILSMAGYVPVWVGVVGLLAGLPAALDVFIRMISR